MPTYNNIAPLTRTLMVRRKWTQDNKELSAVLKLARILSLSTTLKQLAPIKDLASRC